jgi:putative transposase
MVAHKNKIFSKAFKEEAVRLLEQSGRPAAAIAREIGIPRNRLYKWQEQIRAKGPEAFPGSGRQSGESEQLRRGAGHFKKSRGVLCQGVGVRYAFIREHEAMFLIQRMCAVLSVSRSGYYGWRDRPASGRQKANAVLLEQIRRIYLKSRQTYGSPRIHREIREQGVVCGRHRVARLMRRAELVAKMTRRFRLTTRSKMNPPPAPNRLGAPFVVRQANRQWVSDITFIPTRSGWLYLAVVLDLYSRKVIGWAMDFRITSGLVCEALRMAIQQRRPAEGTIVHSDQGGQYTSFECQRLLQHYGLRASMSRKGHCGDNAVVESFFHTLKTELVGFEDYHTRDQARSSLFEYIELFYNRIRRHSTLNYRSPVEFESINLSP